jgi:hypothetical protein
MGNYEWGIKISHEFVFAIRRFTLDNNNLIYKLAPKSYNNSPS